MNRLVKFLANSRLFKGDLDYHLVRASMVLIFVLFGYLLKQDVVRASLSATDRGELPEVGVPRAWAAAEVAAKQA